LILGLWLEVNDLDHSATLCGLILNLLQDIENNKERLCKKKKTCILHIFFHVNLSIIHISYKYEILEKKSPEIFENVPNLSGNPVMILATYNGSLSKFSELKEPPLTLKLFSSAPQYLYFQSI
jgi:hypothetical protein